MSEQIFEVNSLEDKGIAKFDNGIMFADGTQQTTAAVQGPLGAQGLQGTQGTNGNDGAQGLQGTQGTNGNDGAQGVQGLQGIQGTNGNNGSQGVQGLQGQAIQGSQGTAGSSASNSYSFNAQTASYTAQSSDLYKIITVNASGGTTVTVPASTFSTGDWFNVQQIGAGQVTISGASGVTITSTGATASSPKTGAQYAACSVICTGTNTFTVIGYIA